VWIDVQVQKITCYRTHIDFLSIDRLEANLFVDRILLDAPIIRAKTEPIVLTTSGSDRLAATHMPDDERLGFAIQLNFDDLLLRLSFQIDDLVIMKHDHRGFVASEDWQEVRDDPLHNSSRPSRALRSVRSEEAFERHDRSGLGLAVEAVTTRYDLILLTEQEIKVSYGNTRGRAVVRFNVDIFENLQPTKSPNTFATTLHLQLGKRGEERLVVIVVEANAIVRYTKTNKLTKPDSVSARMSSILILPFVATWSSPKRSWIA
jgi:hypothetical protein